MSYKKVRYADFIYMCRMNRSLNVFDDAVRVHVFSNEHYSAPDQLSASILSMKDKINENLIPFEIKITKSKDSGRDESTYWLFCKQNLKIYNNISEYLLDMKSLVSKSNTLEGDINNLTSMTLLTISDDFMGDQDNELSISPNIRPTASTLNSIFE